MRRNRGSAQAAARSEAIGRGWQRAATIPGEDLIVVFNGGGVNTDEIAPFLFKAIRSAKAVPEDQAARQRLLLAITRSRQMPVPRIHEPLPLGASEISGRRFALEVNPLELRSIALAFKNRANGPATTLLGGQERKVPIGLDGRCRFSPDGPEGVPIAGRGRWLAGGAFAHQVWPTSLI
jgi:hypothetical protein